MTPTATPSDPHSILVVANHTCPCPTLADEIAVRAAAQPLSVLVVAPALNSRVRHWVSDVDRALVQARDRVELAVAELSRRGIPVRGEVGDANPLVAIEDALAVFAADELVIATHPPGHSNWLERGLVAKAEERFGLPVTHLISTYGIQQAA